MKHTRRQHLVFLGGALAAPIVMSGAAHAEDGMHEVEMLNFDPDDRQERMLFKPGVLRVEPGDTVKFVATDRGHNAQSIAGMTPEGADDFRGRINEEIEVTFDVEGTYGYVCLPHQSMGMIGFVLVGDFTSNLEDVREAAGSLRGRDTQRRAEEYLAEIDAIAEEEGLV
ncbi:MAG: pseudoazurin [Rhodobacterales bacterium]